MRASPFMAVVTAGVALVGAGADSARAQDWTTAGYDAQRSSWVRAEGKISAATLRRPGFQLLWKLEVADPSTAERALTPPVLLDLVIGYRGFRALAFVAASSDHVVAIDTDLGRVEWERQFAPGAPSTGGLPACVREVTPNLARPTNAALPILIGGAGSRTRQPARGAVGEPGEGAVTLAPLVARRPEAPAPAAPRPPAPRPTPRPFPIVYVLSTDGMLRTLNVMNGADAEPPVPFLPPHANARGLIVVDTVAYVATSRGCGAAPNAVWALDLGTHQVTTWPGRVAGADGPAIGPDGTIYVTTSDGHLVVLEPRTLKPRATYRSGGPAFSSSPVIFDRGGRLLIAASSRDGRIRLLDSRRKTFVTMPLSSQTAADALASWADTDDTHWLVASAGSRGIAIAAWKVIQQDSVPRLDPGWVSRHMPAPLAPAVVNDVIFALSRGAPPSSAVVLHALDGATGNELWNSGATIAPVGRAGLSAGGSQVYVATGDGTLYAFGFPMEH
ncbi:MAG TPA: PQQ-binding-like beta-propeller repeat protein [Gemmatimonadales bacterium]|nr:PQQ-binding-like beta-propeller repeat protein [Gemmatimonadales bacterium]